MMMMMRKMVEVYIYIYAALVKPPYYTASDYAENMKIRVKQNNGMKDGTFKQFLLFFFLFLIYIKTYLTNHPSTL